MAAMIIRTGNPVKGVVRIAIGYTGTVIELFGDNIAVSIISIAKINYFSGSSGSNGLSAGKTISHSSLLGPLA